VLMGAYFAYFILVRKMDSKLAKAAAMETATCLPEANGTV
jgi:hypothetical protein